MAQVVAYLLEALGLLGTVATIVQTIRGILLGDTLNASLAQAEREVHAIFQIVADPTFGNAAIESEVAGINPVILPATPPPGYGAPSSSSNAAAVWNYTLNSDVGTAGQAVTNIRRGQDNVLSNTLIPWQYNPLFLLSSAWFASISSFSPAFFPTVTTASIRKTDTVLTWLQREEPSLTWQYNTYARSFTAALSTETFGTSIWVCIYTNAAFTALKRALFEVQYVPPVWPGLANVVLGTTVPLSSFLALTGPMNGVLVQTLTPTGPKPTYNFGGVNQYRAVGALAFYDDNGEEEEVQPLGFTNQVFTPLHMSLAAGVRFKTQPDVTATVTPWTIP